VLSLQGQALCPAAKPAPLGSVGRLRVAWPGQIDPKMPQKGTQTALLLGAKRSFRMGVAGWSFAHGKRISGRAAVVAVLEELPVICSLAVAAGSMIMIGILLFKDWPQ
jgi:hypothetical protein